MQKFDIYPNNAHSGITSNDSPNIGCTFFNTSASLCISFPYHPSSLKELITKELKEYVKIDGNISSTYFSLGFILAQELLTNDEVNRPLRVIDTLTKSFNCKMLYSDIKTSPFEAFTLTVLNNIKAIKNSLKTRQYTILEDKRRTICKILTDELKKNIEFSLALIQLIRSSLYSYVIGKNQKEYDRLGEHIKSHLWDLPKSEDLIFVKLYSECFDIPLSVIHLTESNYDVYKTSETINSKYHFLIISGKRCFKGVAFPNINSNSLKENSLFEENFAMKSSTCHMRSIKEEEDEYLENYSKSAKKASNRNRSDTEIKKRPVLDDLSSNNNYKQKENTKSSITMCSLCGNQPSDELYTRNPGCGHCYCMYCMMSLGGNSMDRCFVSNCNQGLDKKTIIEFLLNRQSKEGDITFNVSTSKHLETIKETPRISEEQGTIKLNVDIITCPISNEKYNSKDNLPRMLPCGHTISEKVLNKLIKTSKSLDFRCPIDKKVYKRLTEEEFPINASLMDIVLEIEKSQQNLESMKLKLNECIGQIDSWIDSSIDIQKSEKSRFIKEVDCKFNAVVDLLNKKKEEVLSRIETEFEISKKLNKEDEDILNSLRHRFEGEIECLDQLKDGYCQISSTGRNCFESSLQKIQETFENAKNEPQKFYDYYFKSCILEAIFKLLNDSAVFLAEDGKTRLIQF